MASESSPTSLSPVYHIGVIVEDIDKTTKLLSSLLGLGPWQIVEAELREEDMLMGEPCTLKLAGAQLGTTILELLQPIKGKSLWGEFLETKGEGIHHIAYSVENLDEMASAIQEQGGRMLIGGVAPNGKRWAYFETKPGGLVIEFEELSEEGKPTLTP
jgi:catechol 2,3-dioxygenase-like lactoylglutathione lyase family enzyme